MTSLEPVVPLAVISRRLPIIFPAGIPHRGYLTRDIAARTIFVLAYLGAVEGKGRWMRPNQVCRMTDEQTIKTDDESRLLWAKSSMKKRTEPIPGQWYADTTREPIRDETLRTALVPLGAVLDKIDVPTTSSLGRYALARDFYELLAAHAEEPDQSAAETTEAFRVLISEWQEHHLKPEELMRLTLMRELRHGYTADLLVTFPNQETRRMSPGPSSIITKHVIESFATRFLVKPGVIFVSESGNKVVHRDDQLARRIGLNIPADRLLPDLILVDLAKPLVVFVEVVATDGPIDSKRKRDFLGLVREAGYSEHSVAFVTAFADRDEAAFRKALSEIAWNTFVWVASQPDKIIAFRDVGVKPRPLSELIE
jgi:hypothetical protein